MASRRISRAQRTSRGAASLGGEIVGNGHASPRGDHVPDHAEQDARRNREVSLELAMCDYEKVAQYGYGYMARYRTEAEGRVRAWARARVRARDRLGAMANYGLGGVP